MNATPAWQDAIDRAIVQATQAGLPVASHPYAAIAAEIGVPEDVVLDRLRTMMSDGRVRRIGAALNHYAFGLVANGMTVWDVDDAEVGRLGRIVGALDFVSHCYLRPRHPDVWPYNLFAMVHGATRDEVLGKRDRIGTILGSACRGADILFSTEILKKSGLRLRRAQNGGEACSD